MCVDRPSTKSHWIAAGQKKKKEKRKRKRRSPSNGDVGRRIQGLAEESRQKEMAAVSSISIRQKISPKA